MSITRDLCTCTVFILQEHYIRDLVTRYLDGSSRHVHTPTSKTFKDLCPRGASDVPSSGPYSSLVGALLWVAQCTCPDVLFAVARLSQFLRDPSQERWLAAVRVLHYLASTSLLRLSLGSADFSVHGYCDADWAKDRHNWNSTSGLAYLVGCGPISSKSRKQQTVSLSSTEAEYKSLLDSCWEAVWLRNLLAELHLCPAAAIPLHIDNKGAEVLAKNPSHHSCTKHIHTRYHFVQECVNRQEISIRHVKTADMLPDLLTKPLEKTLLLCQRQMLGIV